MRSAIVLLFFAFPWISSAAILLQQTTGGSAQNDNYIETTAEYFQQTIDCADVEGDVEQVTVKVNTGYGGFGNQGPADMKVSFNGTDSNTVEVDQGSAWDTQVFTFSSPVECVAATGVVNMRVINVEPSRSRIEESTTPTYAGGAFTCSGTGSCLNNGDIYFIIEGTAGGGGGGEATSTGTTTDATSIIAGSLISLTTFSVFALAIILVLWIQRYFMA